MTPVHNISDVIALQHVPKGTMHDPALQAAVQRAVATNDRASLTAMAPTLAAAGLDPGMLGTITQAAQQMALTPQGQMVQLAAPVQQALTQLGTQFAQQPLQQHQQQVARAQVQRVTSAIDPQLEQIRRDLDQRSTQIQATSEHRTIEQRQAFRRAVLRRLATIEQAARIQRY